MAAAAANIRKERLASPFFMADAGRSWQRLPPFRAKK
jgi:hypothetical protein